MDMVIWMTLRIHVHKETFLASMFAGLLLRLQSSKTYGNHSQIWDCFQRTEGFLCSHFLVAIWCSCEGPREQRWKCLKCGGGGRKFRKEAGQPGCLLNKERRHVGEAFLCFSFFFFFLGTFLRPIPMILEEGWSF